LLLRAHQNFWTGAVSSFEELAVPLLRRMHSEGVLLTSRWIIFLENNYHTPSTPDLLRRPHESYHSSRDFTPLLLLLSRADCCVRYTFESIEQEKARISTSVEKRALLSVNGKESFSIWRRDSHYCLFPLPLQRLDVIWVIARR
jgi:hypothetical protein